MTRPRPDPDSHPLPSPALDRTVERLTRALAETAEGLEPRPDAFARLAIRVRAGIDPERRAWWWSIPRLALGATVGLLAVVGLAAVVVPALERGQDVQSVAIGGAANQIEPGPITSALPPGGRLAPTTTVTTVVTSAGPNRGGMKAPGPVLGPVGPTPEAAANAFLALIGVPGDGPYTLEQVGDTVAVVALPEGAGTGAGAPAAVLELASLATPDGREGWAVTGATSPGIELAPLLIDGEALPTADVAATGTELAVAGEAAGLLGTVEIELRSALRGDVLAAIDALAGRAGKALPFAATVPLVGTEQAWVLARMTSGDEGTLGSFAVLPLTFAGQPDTQPYVVTRISQSDPEKGLNLRVGPGQDYPSIGIVPQGTVVTRRGDDFPVTSDNGSVWWPVTAGDGDQGWMSTVYLAGAGDGLSPEQVAAAARQFLLAAADPAQVGPWLPVTVGRVVMRTAGSEMVVESRSLQSPGIWAEASFAPGPATDRSLRDLFAVASDPASVVDLPLAAGAGPFLDPALEADSTGSFAGLAAVTASYQGSDGRHHATHFWFESSPTGPRLVGVLFEVAGT